MQGKTSSQPTQTKRIRAVPGRQWGYVSEWKNHYGWLDPDEEIQHAEAKKHGGRIYVQASDVKGNQSLYSGARVSFYAYADGDGIGAEQVKLEAEAANEDTNEAFSNRVPGSAPDHIPGMPPPTKSKSKKNKESATTSATAWLASTAAADAKNKQPKAVQPRGVAAQVASLAAGYSSSSSRGGIGSSTPTSLQADRPEKGQGSYSVAASLKELSRESSAFYPPAPPFPAPPPVPNCTSQSLSGSHNTTQVSPLASREKWWRVLDDSCPISLELISDLDVEPFGLLGSNAEGAEVPTEGVWGSRATKAMRDSSLGAIHWFDGMFLASFLVSSSQFIDVVSRRPLTRGECISLDSYLSANKLPAVHVADAYDLCQSIASRQGGPEANNQDRITALEREAASMLRSLFDFRSNSRVQPPPPPPRASHPSGVPPPPSASSRVGPRTGLGGCNHEFPIDSNEADWPGPSVAMSPNVSMSSQLCQQRTVHSEGGLTIVDDSEYDEVNVTTGADQNDSSDPTPAEALAKARGGKAKAPRAPRNPKLVSGQKEHHDVAQVSFSLSAGRGRAFGEPVRGPGIGSGASSSTSPVLEADIPLACDVWVPGWASAELHQRLLSEVQSVQSRFGETFNLMTPQVKAHLEECVRIQCATDKPDNLEFEILHHLGGSPGGEKCMIHIALPPYYPVHSAVVALHLVDASTSTASRSMALERLQQVLRTEVIAPLEGSETILKTLDWLSRHGLMQLARLERELLDEQQPGPCASFGPALSKSERIQESKKERMNSKFSGEWAVCYALKKYGRCNDKNCQWFHGAS